MRRILVSLAAASFMISCGGGDSGTGGDVDSGSHVDSSHGDGTTDSATTDSGSPDSRADSSAIDSSSTDSTTDSTADSTASETTGDTSSGTDTATTDTGAATDTTPPPDTTTTHAIKTVFVIMMENHDWSAVKGSGSAPYINGTLLPMAAWAENYKTPPGNHPSEPNYIWLEAGDNLGITDDNDPSSNHQATTDHLSTQLETAGLTWKAYVEEIDGSSCPLTSSGLFGAKHTPQLFFDDVTDTNSTTSAHCIAHIRPLSELATDLSSGSVPNYNFITPNLCDDMHGDAPFGSSCNPFIGADLVKMGDDWLKTNVPIIMASSAYTSGGAIFIIWDEGTAGITGTSDDGPMGMIVLSPFAKANHPGSTAYTHSSTLRTFEEIFGLPTLRAATTSNDLSELFTTFP